MSQYQQGTVDVTNGVNAVVGTDTLWLANVQPGNLFVAQGDHVYYEVGAVTDDTHLNLSAPYAGVTGTDLSYAISRDFTPNLGLPYPVAGDVDTAATVRRLAEYLDSYISGVLHKSVAGGSDVTLTALEQRAFAYHFTGALSAAINVIVAAKTRWFMVFNATTGGGAATLTIKTPAGTGIEVNRDKRAVLACDGVNVVRVSADA